MAFLKLKDLSEITVGNISTPYWVSWDAQALKYIRYREQQKGAQQKWDIVNGSDRTQISKDQLGQMLIACCIGTESSIKNRTFTIKTNGKDDKEIRYFLNLKNE